MIIAGRNIMQNARKGFLYNRDRYNDFIFLKIDPDIMDATQVIDMFKLNGLKPPSEVERVAATMRENPDLN